MKKSKLSETMVLEFSELEPCSKQVEVTIPAETVENEMKLITKEFVAQVNIPGFRQGKAPLQIVKKRYKDSIEQEFLRKIHISAFEQINQDSKMDPVTMPLAEATPKPPLPKTDYKFSLKFNVAPDFKLPNYKGIKLKKEEVKISDKEINQEIDKYREMYAEFKTLESSAKPGDMLKISFTSDIECPEDALASYKRLVSAENSWCWLSEPEMLPGITKALTGVKAGETKELKVDFPADFTEPLLAGKKGKYSIKIEEVQRREPLTDDKELCKRINIDNIEDLKKQIIAAKEGQAKYENIIKLQTEAIEAIIKEVGEIDLPPILLTQATQMQLKRIISEVVKSEADVEGFKKDTEKHQKNAKEEAKKRLVKFFVSRAITIAEKIEVNEEELENNIKTLAITHGYNPKEFKQQLEESGGAEELHMDITIEKAATFIIDNADFGVKKDEKTAKKKKDDTDVKKTEKKEPKKK